MSYRYFGRTFAAAVVALSSVFAINFAPIASAAAGTCTWTGGGADDNFSTAANWSGCDAAGIPEAGDTVSFDHTLFPAANVMLVNDLSVTLAGVTLTDSDPNTSAPQNLHLTGLSLTDGAVINGVAGTYLSLLTGNNTTDGTLTSAGDVSISNVNVNTSFSNKGNFNVPGNLSIINGSISLYAENTVGKVLLSSNSGVNYRSKTEGALNVPHQLQTSDTSEQYITFATYCQTYAGMGCSTGFKPVTYNMSGSLTLSGNISVSAEADTIVNLNGTKSGTGSIVLSPYSVGTVNIGGQTVTNPEKSTDVTGTDDTRSITVIQNETTTLTEGSVVGNLSVLNGGLLKGTGTVKYGAYVAPGAKIAPGMSPGCLTVGSLEIEGEYVFELGGVDACSGYDQIKVTDTTVGTPSTVLESTSILSTVRWNGYTPNQGQVFTIIDNQGPEAVQGTFKDLAEGATFEQNGVVFKVSYVGGSGNDVTLTVQNVPTAPDTGFELVKANPGVTMAVTVMSAFGLIAMGRRMKNAR